MRLFVFNVTPTAGAPNTEDVAGGIAHVWVNEADRQTAEDAARAYVMAQAWVITGLEHALLPTPEQIAQLDAVESAAHRRALREGIYGWFVGWPKEPRDENDPVELRPLPTPPTPKGEH